MMIDRQTLVELISKLDNAEPCTKHGREYLEICIECQEAYSTQCGECESMSCQCWNDE